MSRISRRETPLSRRWTIRAPRGILDLKSVSRVSHPAQSMSESSTPAGALPRRLGLWSAVAVVIGITIGSGIFRTPAGIARKLPGPLPLFGVWIAGGIVALCGALTLAEVAGAFPQTGGIYVFIRNAFGRLPAFLFGWAELAIIRAAAVGAIATTFAEYLLRVLGFDPSLAPYDGYVHYVAALAILVISVLNGVGVRWGSLVQNVTTVAKYFGLLFIVIVAIAIGLPKTGGHFTPALPSGSFSIAPFGLALVSVLWAYDGWADLAFISGEVKDPERNLPRALIFGTIAVVAIYLLANVAYLGVMTVEEIGQSKLVAADVAFRLIGQPGVVLVVDDRDAVDARHAQRFDPHQSARLLRDGRGRIALPQDRGGASALPDAVRRDRAHGGAWHRVRVAAHLRAARRHLRDGNICPSTRSVSRRSSCSASADTIRPSARRSIPSRPSCSCSRRSICSSTR